MSGMSAQKVAVVTGSNKGIGLAIVEKLCRNLGSGWDVFLTSRDESRGQSAVQELKAKGVNPKFHQLDISSNESIKNLAEFLKKNYGGLDILVNNAGIAYKNDSTAPFAEQAEVTVKTNFWGVLATCDALFPLLRPHARVVHIGSGVSDMTLNKTSPELQKRLTTEMSLDEVKQLMTEFVEAAKQGRHKEIGWPDSAYGPSKVGVRLLTYAQAKLLECDPREDVVLNGCCPGYVDTDMSSHKGHLTTEQGADTPVFLATLEPNVSKEFVGKHFYKREVIPWAVGTKIVF